MVPVLDLAGLVVEGIRQTLAEPVNLLPLALVCALTGVQIRRRAKMERAIFGAVWYPALRQLMQSILWGIGGGAVATLLFLTLGIALPEEGLGLMWILALLLMLIHPRFLCFAYSGGIVALCSLLFGFPEVNVAGAMGLVAVLHLVESLLVLFTGAQAALPVWIRHADGRTVGAFAMQKVWPVPFFAVIGFVLPRAMDLPEPWVAMPDWWPLIGAGGGEAVLYFLLPVAAGLGYGDVAVTSPPDRKARRASLYLLLYSLVLLLLAVLSVRHAPAAYAAALFAPLGHEWLIHRSRRDERTGEPLFTSARGPMVMAVKPRSAAEAMGLAAGDVIRRVNGTWVRTLEDLQAALAPCAGVEVVVEGAGGAQRVVRYEGRVPPLGIVVAPGPDHPAMVRVDAPGLLGRWLGRVRTRLSG